MQKVRLDPKTGEWVNAEPAPQAPAGPALVVDPATGRPTGPSKPRAAPGSFGPPASSAAPSPLAPTSPGGVPPGWEPVADAKPEDRRPGVGPRVWDVVLGIVLGGIALLFVFQAAVTLFAPELIEDAAADIDYQEALWQQSALLLVGFGALPFAWGLGTRVRPWLGTLRYFRLDRVWPDALWGVATALGIFAVMMVVGLAVIGSDKYFGTELGDNPELDRIQEAITWPLAIMVALSAAVGEEILFRGFLQRKIGIWGQAVVFGLTHMGYGTVLQVVLPFALGILFGFIVKRRGSIWAPIVAHFLYDFTVLSIPLVTE